MGKLNSDSSSRDTGAPISRERIADLRELLELDDVPANQGRIDEIGEGDAAAQLVEAIPALLDTIEMLRSIEANQDRRLTEARNALREAGISEVNGANRALSVADRIGVLVARKEEWRRLTGVEREAREAADRRWRKAEGYPVDETTKGRLTIDKAQANQPWEVPYGPHIKGARNQYGRAGVRDAMARHALLHLVKTSGKIAAAFEAADHTDNFHHANPDRESLIADMSADLVTVALRFANLYGFSLSGVLVKRTIEKNGRGFEPKRKKESCV